MPAFGLSIVKISTTYLFFSDIFGSPNVLPSNPDWDWDGLKWYGASPMAYKKMFNKAGYTPVYIHVDDMIAIRNDVLEENGFSEPEWEQIYPHENVGLYNTHTMGGTKPLVTELNLNEWEEV